MNIIESLVDKVKNLNKETLLDIAISVIVIALFFMISNLISYVIIRLFSLKEKDKKIKEELIMLQDKIKGVYIGSKQEEKELNLKEETGKKYNLLTRAIKEKRKVKLLYYSYGKGENQRIIYPAEMFLFQNGWYCAAFCEMRQDIRHFELKRIINCELLDEKYE